MHAHVGLSAVSLRLIPSIGPSVTTSTLTFFIVPINKSTARGFPTFDTNSSPPFFRSARVSFSPQCNVVFPFHTSERHSRRETSNCRNQDFRRPSNLLLSHSEFLTNSGGALKIHQKPLGEQLPLTIPFRPYLCVQ